MENTQKPSNTPRESKDFSAFTLGLELGFIIAIPLVIFLLLGVFVDKKLHTLPLFTIIGLLVSFGITFTGVKNLILPFLEKRSQSKNNKTN